MIFFQISASSGQNLCYLIGDEETKEAAVIDPSGEVEKIMKLATENELRIKYIINTHSHADHTAGNNELASKTGAKLLLHKKARIKKDIDLSDGDTITIGNKKIEVIYTPGHSPDSICLLLENKLLTGDTLFVGECGRTDIPGGSSEDLYDSLFEKIKKMRDELEIYPGHDYGGQKTSTLGYEKRNNYVLEQRTKEEFIKFMMED